MELIYDGYLVIIKIYCVVFMISNGGFAIDLDILNPCVKSELIDNGCYIIINIPYITNCGNAHQDVMLKQK